MAKEYNILGIESFEIGAPGDGVMGGALVTYSDIEKNSVNITGQTAEENTIETEADDSYITLNSTVTPSKLKARLYGIPYANLPALMGGTTVGEKWSEPQVKPNIFLSVRLTATEIDGFKTVIEIPYAKFNAKWDGTIGKDQLPAVDIEMTANTPVTALGVKGSPLTIERVAV